MNPLNPSTYLSQFRKEPIRAEIGDVKQLKFYPRVKLSKWDNEANFSLGLALSPKGNHSISKDGIVTYKDGDISARFYNLINADDVPLKSIRQVAKDGKWTALEAAAQYEMFNDIGKPGEMLLAKYITTEPAMVAFDNMPVDTHMDVNKQNMVKDFDYPDKSGYNADDIPMPSFNRLKLVRFLTPYTPLVNPMYMDDRLVQIIVQWRGSELDPEQVCSIQMDAVEHVMNSRGYPTERHPFRAKLYVRHGDRLVKFFSGQPDKGGLYSYVNLKTNYNKAYDFYKPDIFKDIRDKYAYGLQYIYPEIQDSIVDEMIDEFAKRLNVPIKDKPLTKEETAHWQTLQKLHDNHDWISKAKRSDANWFRPQPKDGLEFEVVLAKKPRNNLVKLTANNPKNVTAYYQAELSFEEMAKENIERPLDVMKSLSVYHNEKRNNEYKTGKLTHIYRPIAWDSTGLKVWCDFKELEGLKEGQIYDLSKGLTIVVPKDFLDKAKYPVTVDPTFGYTSAGATAGSAGNTIIGQSLTGALGTVDSVVAYIAQTGLTSALCKTAIYKGSDSSYVVGSTEQTPAAGPGWVTFTGFSNQQIGAITYNLVIWSQVTTGTYASQVNMYYNDSVSGWTGKTQTITYVTGNSPTGWPTTGSFSDQASRQYSIYCNYTDLPFGPRKPKIINQSINRSASF